MTATNPHVEPFVAAMRDMDPSDRYPYAIGCIQAFAKPYRTDAEVAAGVRDVLAALDLVTKGDPADGAGR